MGESFKVQRNIVFLVDSSSSMKEKAKAESHFQKSIKAIQKIFSNPEPTRSQDYLTVIFFWLDLLKGFKTEVVYQNVSMGTLIDPQKLIEFGEPPSYAATRLEEGLDYAIKFLEDKQGEKIIKLITDNNAIAQKARGKNKFRFIEKEIRFDTIIVGETKNKSSPKVVGISRLGQNFEESEIDAVAKALLFW
jgi:hypothetical protein